MSIPDLLLTSYLSAAMVSVVRHSHPKPTPGNSDAELLALCDEFHANRTETDAIWESGFPLDGGPDAERSEALSSRYHEIREDLAAMPARTPEGIAAKARIILNEFEGEDNVELPNQYDSRGALALSLARDILGREA